MPGMPNESQMKAGKERGVRGMHPRLLQCTEAQLHESRDGTITCCRQKKLDHVIGEITMSWEQAASGRWKANSKELAEIDMQRD